MARLNRLTTEQEIFDSVDSAGGGTTQEDIERRKKMLANFLAPQRLILRLGAQVMLIWNVNVRLVNGSMGKVIRFNDPAINGIRYPVVEFDLPNGLKTQMLVLPRTWTAESPNDKKKENIQVSRTQVCLLLQSSKANYSKFYRYH